MNNSSKHSPSMSGRVIRTNRNSASTDSAVTFDHMGNPLWLGCLLIVLLALVAWKCAKRIQGKLYIYKISTSNRRFIRQVKRLKNGADRFIDPLPCEIDNHADTTCFGKNFRAISFTSQVCTVSPYLSEYNSLSDIPICTAATAVDLDSGETIILEFGQGLWLGERMEHSLINPNQCRSFGVRVCAFRLYVSGKLGKISVRNTPNPCDACGFGEEHG